MSTPNPQSSVDGASTTLDLHDIALLLNYERVSTEPRFRYTKLHEIIPPGGEFQTIRATDPCWHEARVPRAGMVLACLENPKTPEARSEPDLPTNMLLNIAFPSLLALTCTQLETYFWQARNHNACFASARLFQHFFDLLLSNACVRVRVIEGPDNKVKEYIHLKTAVRSSGSLC